jgi:hypothetical protein
VDKYIYVCFFAPTGCMAPGLFKSVCASIFLAEFIQDFNALRLGEKYPLIVSFDAQKKLILSPEFDRIYNMVKS